jgi:hypothetical protein
MTPRIIWFLATAIAIAWWIGIATFVWVVMP